MWIGVLNFVMTRPYCLSCGNVPTRVLWLHGRTAPVFRQIVLAAPEGDLPDDAVYLGRSAHHRSQHSQFVEPAAEHVEIILLVANSDTAAPTLKDPEIGGVSVEHPEYVEWLGSSTSPPGSMIETSVFLCLLWP